MNGGDVEDLEKRITNLCCTWEMDATTNIETKNQKKWVKCRIFGFSKMYIVVHKTMVLKWSKMRRIKMLSIYVV